MFGMQTRLEGFFSKGAAAWGQLAVLGGLVRAFLFILALPCREGGRMGAHVAGEEPGRAAGGQSQL